MAEKIVNGGEVEVHLPCVLRLEWRHLQLNDTEASKLQVIEKQIELKIFSADFEGNLAPDEGEAGAEFDKELAQVLQQSPLQVTLLRLRSKRQESKLYGKAGGAIGWGAKLIVSALDQNRFLP